MPAWLIIALLALFLWQGDGNPLEGALTVLNEITRGKRLTHASYGGDGVVSADPQDLADHAGLSLDEYALARMLSSEEGQSSNRVKAAVAHAALNHAARAGKTIAQLLLHAQDPNHSGRFGTFINKDEDSPYYSEDSNGNPNHADRYASTALDPYDGDGQIAAGCIDGSIPDETGGADQFDRPSGEKHPDKIAAERVSEGKTLVMLDGIDDLRFWRS